MKKVNFLSIFLLGADGELHDLINVSPVVEALGEYYAYRLYARDQSGIDKINVLLEEVAKMTSANAANVASIIGHVGEIVGRTKLQKTFALLELVGLGAGFNFSYHIYGPYSEELSEATDRAVLLQLVKRREKIAKWGGRYSVF